MIPVADFADYARDFAEDIGATFSTDAWPLRRIDWRAAADELSQDHTEVTSEGTDYHVRLD